MDHDGDLIAEDDPERSIPVRVNGITVMMSSDEYAGWRANRNAQGNGT